MAMPRREEAVEQDVLTGETEAYAASQWQLMWWKFRKHHLAMAAGMVIVALYVVGCVLRVFGTLYAQSSAGLLMRLLRLSVCNLCRMRACISGRLCMGSRACGIRRRFGSSISKTARNAMPYGCLCGARPIGSGVCLRTDVHLFGVDDGGTLFFVGDGSSRAGFAFEDYLRFAHFADNRVGGGDTEFCVWSGDRRGVRVLRRLDRQSHSARD